MTLRQAGNGAFGRGEWEAAAAAYSLAIAAAPGDGLAWSNRAAAQLKAGWPVLAFGDATRAGELDGKNVKARLREGEAAEGMGMWEGALEAYVRLLPPADRSPAAIARIAAAGGVVPPAAPALAPEAAALQAELYVRIPRSVAERDAAAAAGDAHAAIARLPSRYRGGKGGGRAPAAVLAAGAAWFGATSSVVVREAGGGFGVFATAALPAGATVHVDTPLVSYTLNNERRCHHCMRLLPSSAFARVPCASCTKVFCSAACADTAAVAYHAAICGAGAEELEDVVRSTATTPSAYFPLLALKLWGMAVSARRSGGGSGGGGGGGGSSSTGTAAAPGKRYREEEYVARASLPPDSPAAAAAAAAARAAAAEARTTPPADLRSLAVLCRATDAPAPDTPGNALPMSAEYLVAGWRRFQSALGRAALEDPAADMDAFAAVVALLQSNAIGVRAAGESRRLTGGVALMGGGSFFNHSCAPNLSWTTDADAGGHAITFVTSTAVAAGDELTIAYVPVDMPTAARRERLAAQYGFDCTCARCTRELLLAP
mgnify:CR=1 FL=1